MYGESRGAITAAVVSVLLAAGSAQAQSAQEPGALARATAQALEPGIRAALRDGQPASFETRSDWGLSVRSLLESSLGVGFVSEHRRGSSRILLGGPSYSGDTATVEVWFGRCEGDANEEFLRVRMYAFTFRHAGEDWTPMRSARLGTREGSCDGDWQEPGPVQT